MATDLTQIDTLRSKVEKHFRDNKLTYTVDTGGDYVVNNESTAVIVRPFKWNDKYSAIRIIAPVSFEVTRVTYELVYLIATMNSQINFCRLYFDESEKAVYCCTELIGENLSMDHFGMSIFQVAMTANDLDEKVSHIAGGKRLVDL